jgi:hypothetical protein
VTISSSLSEREQGGNDGHQSGTQEPLRQIAQEMAETAEKAGAEVRLRKVAELAPQAAMLS